MPTNLSYTSNAYCEIRLLLAYNQLFLNFTFIFFTLLVLFYIVICICAPIALSWYRSLSPYVKVKKIINGTKTSLKTVFNEPRATLIGVLQLHDTSTAKIQRQLPLLMALAYLQCSSVLSRAPAKWSKVCKVFDISHILFSRCYSILSLKILLFFKAISRYLDFFLRLIFLQFMRSFIILLLFCSVLLFAWLSYLNILPPPFFSFLFLCLVGWE